jgi:hypothetical protein
MRTFIVAMFLLVGFSLAGVSHAQTWDHPLTFNTNPYNAYGNSCSLPPQNLILDNEFQVYAPAVVYIAWNLQLPPPHPKNTFKPRTIHLAPQGPTDFSIWVCSTHNGNSLSNCVDASDNGTGSFNSVTVPAQAGTFYVVITGGIAAGLGTCGPYTLTEYY